MSNQNDLTNLQGVIESLTTGAGGFLQAKASNKKAKTIRQAAANQARQEGRQSRALAAEQRLGFAGAGVDPDRGTPVDVVQADLLTGEAEALNRQFVANQIADQEKTFGTLSAYVSGLQSLSLAAQTPASRDIGRRVQKFFKRRKDLDSAQRNRVPQPSKIAQTRTPF